MVVVELLVESVTVDGLVAPPAAGVLLLVSLPVVEPVVPGAPMELVPPVVPPVLPVVVSVLLLVVPLLLVPAVLGVEPVLALPEGVVVVVVEDFSVVEVVSRLVQAPSERAATTAKAAAAVWVRVIFIRKLLGYVGKSQGQPRLPYGAL